MDNKLKIAIVLDNNLITNWLFELIEVLYTNRIINEVNFYVIGKDGGSKKNRINLFIRFYLFIDGLVNKKYKYQTFQKIDKVLNKLKNEQISSSMNFDFHNIEKNDLAIWLNSSYSIPDFSESIQYGIWHSNLKSNTFINFTILYNLLFRKDIFFFRLSIKKLESIDVYRSSFRFYDRSYLKSLKRFEENLINVFYSKLLQVYENRNFDNLKSNSNLVVEDYSPKKPPIISFQAMLLLFLLMLEKVRNIFIKEQWFLVIKASNRVYIPKIIEYIPSLDKFWADPFLFELNNTKYLFFEEFEEKVSKGNISYFKLSENGEIVGKPKVIIDQPYHLSYPFIFEFENQIYMIPETSENCTIELYKAVQFPDKWEKIKVIMQDIFALDSTLFFHDGYWWLFTNIKNTKTSSSDTDLHLFYSSEPINGEWHAHPRNPIVTDIQGARPAGKIYIKDGEILRPSQDCSKRYGYGIVINKVLVLSKTEYKEKIVDRITPEKNKFIAWHTINCDTSMSVFAFDAMKRVNKYRLRKTQGLSIKEIRGKQIAPFDRLQKHLE